MNRFLVAHATHPDWRMALSLVLAPLQAALARVPDMPRLGVVYLTDHLGRHARELLAGLVEALPGVQAWTGSVALGVLADEAEYVDEPALAVMLCDLPAQSFRLFSGMAPLRGPFAADTALVHADGQMVELAANVQELAARMDSGQLFGALGSARAHGVQLLHDAEAGGHVLQVLSGGLCGVAFRRDAGVHGRLIQGCRPLSREYVVTEADGGLVLQLDGEPALERMLRDLDLSLDEPRAALQALRNTLVAINGQPQAQRRYAGQLPAAAQVRQLLGVDPTRGGIALAEPVEAGHTLTFCRRDRIHARTELRRVCTALRDALEPDELDAVTLAQRRMAQEQHEALPADGALAQGLANPRIAGAIYLSCMSRGNGYFGDPGAELRALRQALGPVPLVGMMAGGEIAHAQVHAYSGVLLLFARD